MDLDFNFKFRVVAQISKQSEFSGLILCTGHSSLILLFQCMNGADRTGPIKCGCEPLERPCSRAGCRLLLQRCTSSQSLGDLLENLDAHDPVTTSL